MSSLLERQVKRYLNATHLADPQLAKFLAAVDDAYSSATDDRLMLEHSLSLSSFELKARYDALQADIARRQRAENERDTFFQLSPDLLCILEADLTFKQVNPSWQRALGFELDELRGVQLTTLIHEAEVAKTSSELRGPKALSGASVAFQSRCRTKSGTYRWLWWTSVVDRNSGCVYCVVRDVTEQRVLEAELAQAQKLEAVGQLASGVAHEINSPIQFVGDNVQFVHDSLLDLMGLLDAVDTALASPVVRAADLEALRAARDAADVAFLRTEIPKALSEARDGVHRVAELVRALKEFAHADQPEMAVANLNKSIERTLVLARHEVKYVADVDAHLGPLPSVQCHLGALNQVFLNLIINAGHAIEDRRKRAGNTVRGTISISTKQEGDWVVVAVHDTGCGIPPEVQPRIFEPFFTTKEVGRGSGQGLALARAIVVDRHKGRLEFETTVGEGTTFFVRLPITQPRASAA